MLKTLAVVEFPQPPAAVNRVRLAQRRLCGRPLFEWVLRRVSESQQIDSVLALVGESQEARQAICQIPPDISVFVGEQGDVLANLAAALHDFPATNFVRINVDNPFIDPILIDRLIATAERHPGYDYISFQSGDGRPAVLSQVGIFAEWYCTEALQRAHQEAIAKEDRENVTRYFMSHPERFQIRLIPVPAELDSHDVRLTVRVDQDWEHVEEILEAIGTDELDWQRIANLLAAQPGLRRTMASLNRAALV